MLTRPIQIQMDGPHTSRKQRRKALLRAAVALAIALVCIVGAPMLSGMVYGRGLH